MRQAQAELEPLREQMRQMEETIWTVNLCAEIMHGMVCEHCGEPYRETL